jgi:hypothetical protein
MNNVSTGILGNIIHNTICYDMAVNLWSYIDFVVVTELGSPGKTHLYMKVAPAYRVTVSLDIICSSKNMDGSTLTQFYPNTSFTLAFTGTMSSAVDTSLTGTLASYTLSTNANTKYLRLPNENGYVGIGTSNPVTNLHVAGSIFARDGLYRSKSKYLTGSYSGSTWHTVFNGSIDTDLTSGVYILKALADNHAAGGRQYMMTYSGIFTWFSGGANSGNGEGITTHRCGHAPNDESWSFRTLQNYGGGNVFLQIYSNFSWTSLDTTSGRTVLVEVTRIA